MRGLLTSLIAAELVAGCGCGEAGSTGQADGVDDPWILDGPCAVCDDGNPCTMDLCNTETMECVNLAMDMDGDGHTPIVCGGDDCDDTRSDVYTGSAEVCLDGVDQDCDTLVDGPMPMMDDVRVSDSDDQNERPRMVWTGSEFVTIWHNKYLDEHFFISLARLGPAGDIVEGEGTIIDSPAYRPSPAWTGSKLALSWAGYEPEPSVQVLLLSPTGDDGTTLEAAADADRTHLAWTGSRFGIGYDNTRNAPEFLMLDSDGTLVAGPTGIVTSTTNVEALSLAWTGSEFGMVWEGLYGAWAFEISFARLNGFGEQVGASMRLTDGGYSRSPDLIWTGSEFGVAWIYYNPNTIYFMKVDTLGNRTSEVERVSDIYLEPSETVRIAWTGSDFGVVWMEGLYDDLTIGFALLDSAGKRKGETIQVTDERNRIYSPDLAWTGSEFGVVWTDMRDGDLDCYEEADRHCLKHIYFNRIGMCD